MRKPYEKPAIVFREKIERQFSIPLEEWRKRHRGLEEADYFLYRQ